MGNPSREGREVSEKRRGAATSGSVLSIPLQRAPARCRSLVLQRSAFAPPALLAAAPSEPELDVSVLVILEPGRKSGRGRGAGRDSGWFRPRSTGIWCLDFGGDDSILPPLLIILYLTTGNWRSAHRNNFPSECSHAGSSTHYQPGTRLSRLDPGQSPKTALVPGIGRVRQAAAPATSLPADAARAKSAA